MTCVHHPLAKTKSNMSRVLNIKVPAALLKEIMYVAKYFLYLNN